jgi:hypothetical protein
MAPVCTGHGVAAAGRLITDGHALNHVVLLDAGGQPFEWTTGMTPQEWTPVSAADTELVACVGERQDVEIQVCPYYGGDITRYRSSWPLTVRESATGTIVEQFDISVDARYCKATEVIEIGQLTGHVSTDVLSSYLAGLVEQGVFVPPSPAASFDIATDKPAARTPSPSSVARTMTLSQALAEGAVTVSGTGDGLAHLDLEVTSHLAETLALTIAAGTLLDPAAKGTQTMVVLFDQPIELEANETASTSLDVACAEMHQDQPTSDDTFTVSAAAPESDLKLLLAAPGLADADGRVRQFAVWTITNDPKRGDYVPLGTSFDIFGSGPDDEEIAQIRTLFEAAGIDTAKYRALRKP